MIKIRFSVGLILSIVLVFTVQAQAFPDFPTVLNELLSKYNITHTQYKDKEVMVHLLDKRLNGWYFTTVYYRDGVTVAEKETNVLFWSKQQNSYLKLSEATNPNKTPDPRAYEAFINAQGSETERMYYRISPCYGYNGWEKDIISMWGSKPSLPDSSLYMLGRAYSAYAGNLLLAFGTIYKPSYQINLPEGLNALTTQQLAEFRKYHHNAVKSFERLTAQNPHFETLVGNIRIKAANEKVTGFLYLCMVQNEEEGLKELNGVNYPENMLMMARNYLNSCGQNGILITNGDNDTFPLLYLQAKETLRTDVTVINTSLLNLPRYAEMIRNQKFAKNYSFLTTPENFKTANAYCETGYRDTAMLGTFLEDYYQGKNRNSKVSWLYFKAEGSPDMCWRLPRTGYLSKSDMILLDILNTNHWVRPFYFLQTVSSSSMLNLGSRLCPEGLALRLYPEGTPPLQSDYLLDKYITNWYCCFDETKEFQLLTKEFQYPNTLNRSESEYATLGLLRKNLVDFAGERLVANDTTQTLAILALLKQSNNLYPGIEMIKLQEIHYLLGEKEEAQKLSNIMQKAINNPIAFPNQAAKDLYISIEQKLKETYD